MTREKALERACRAIQHDDILIYDVASSVCPAQIVANVKHMYWFREAVADWIQDIER